MSEREGPVWVECDDCDGEGFLPYGYNPCHECNERGGFWVSRKVADRRFPWITKGPGWALPDSPGSES